MTNAFHWQGKPSIFTTNVPQQNFGEAMTRKHLATAMRRKPIKLHLSAKEGYNEPDLILKRNPRKSADALKTGGDLGRRTKV